MGYPKEVLEFDYGDVHEGGTDQGNLGLCMNTNVFDIENGNMLRLGEGMEVLIAVKGYKKLSNSEIEAVYGTPAIFRAV